MLAYGIVASYDWAQFPYDNLCDPDTNVTSGLDGTYEDVKLLNGDTLPSVTVEHENNTIFCSQSWRGSEGFAFPATADQLQAGDSHPGKCCERR